MGISCTVGGTHCLFLELRHQSFSIPDALLTSLAAASGHPDLIKKEGREGGVPGPDQLAVGPELPCLELHDPQLLDSSALARKEGVLKRKNRPRQGGTGERVSLAYERVYLFMLINSCSISSTVVTTRVLAWKPR